MMFVWWPPSDPTATVLQLCGAWLIVAVIIRFVLPCESAENSMADILIGLALIVTGVYLLTYGGDLFV